MGRSRSERVRGLLRRLIPEVNQQMVTAFPTLVSMLLYKLPWLISLRFVGMIGTEELAAAALAATICNVTGLSLSVGLSSALTTLTGQARGRLLQQRKLCTTTTESGPGLNSRENTTNSAGEKTCLLDASRNATVESAKPLLPLVFLYRGIAIQFAFVIPVGIWWLVGIQPTLIRLGQPEQLSLMTQSYLRILTPGLWSYSLNWTLTAWLQTIEMSDVPGYAAAAGLAIHVPCNYFFVYFLGWGYLGVAVATVVFQLIQPFLILSYLFGTKQGRDRFLHQVAADAIGRTELSFWKEAQLALFDASGIRTYLGMAIPGIVIISEWWASEVAIFLSGQLTPSSELALGGMTLYQSINTFCFMFPVAFGIAGSTRVGNQLGANDPRGAAFAGHVSIVCAGLSSAILSLILFITPHTFFPSLFAPLQQDLVAESSRTIPLLALYVLADGIQSAFNGIVKGCGRQTITMPIVIFAYWIVGVPLAYFMAFVHHDGTTTCTSGPTHFGCGIVGLVFGMTVGTWTHMLLLGVVLLFTIRWEGEAQAARERLSAAESRATTLISPGKTADLRDQDALMLSM